MKCKLYTDGAYSRLNNEGAFAFVILDSNNLEIKRKAYKIASETNNRAELKAIIAGVHQLPPNVDSVDIYSDSQYALNTLSGKWSHNNNDDLFDSWNKVKDRHKNLVLNFFWVKGHAGNYWNEVCDGMCSDILGYDPANEYTHKSSLSTRATGE